MKKAIISFLGLVCLVVLLAQEKMFLHKSNGTVIEMFVTAIDSAYFNSNNTELNIRTIDNAVSSYSVSTIDSITFADETTMVSVAYSGTSVIVTNPLQNLGVSVSISGADVVINSTVAADAVKFSLSGTTTDGALKIYSSYRFGLELNGVNITNARGPAINIQSSKKISVILADGTTNSLTDAAIYATSVEDQKGAFFSEGQLQFSGNGTLLVKSNSKHGICSDDYIQIDNGNITITAAAKDGIHAKDYFRMNGGTLNVNATSDAIDCELGHVIITAGSISTVSAVADTKGISCDSTMTISGGIITQIVSGNQAKGLKSKQAMFLNGGTITINASGAAVLTALGSGFDPSYNTGIKCGTDLTIAGANITVTSTGAEGKAISSDGNLIMTSGTVNASCSGTGATYVNSTGVTDSYNSSCFTADLNISVIGGSLTCTNTGKGGKAMSADGTVTIGSATASPTIKLTTTGARFLVSGTDYCHPKTLVASGAIVINNGVSTINSTDDGIHSATSITVNGGNTTVNAISSTSGVGEGVEAPIITFNGGVSNITASNDGINATMGTKAGGVETNDGSHLYIKGGIVIVAGSDAIDSNGSITVTGGTTIVNGPSTGMEEGIDYNGALNLNGGTFISAGSNSNMTKAMSTSSTQPSMYIKSGSLISSSSLLHIENASGTEMITYKPKNGGYYYHFSSPGLTKSTAYKIYVGGSYTGGNFIGNTINYGLYSGGTYSASGATLKSTSTLSASSTVNTISF